MKKSPYNSLGKGGVEHGIGEQTAERQGADPF
jgi:hypothetical protein